MDEELGLVGDVVLWVADVDYASGEGYFFDGEAEGFGEADGFDDDVRAVAGGEVAESFGYVFVAGVDEVGGSG